MENIRRKKQRHQPWRVTQTESIYTTIREEANKTIRKPERERERNNSRRALQENRRENFARVEPTHATARFVIAYQRAKHKFLFIVKWNEEENK